MLVRNVGSILIRTLITVAKTSVDVCTLMSLLIQCVGSLPIDTM